MLNPVLIPSSISEALGTDTNVDIDKYVTLENVSLTAKYPPEKKPNWLLIGGIAVALFLLFKKS